MMAKRKREREREREKKHRSVINAQKLVNFKRFDFTARDEISLSRRSKQQKQQKQ